MSDTHSKPHLNLVVIGHHKSGKSTVMGRLLYELGTFNIDKQKQLETNDEKQMDNIFAHYVTKTKEEKQNGHTIHSTPVFEINTETYHYSCRDAPGYHKYTKNVIKASACCDVALLIISAQNYPQHFQESIQKTNFKKGKTIGGTRHHPTICYALGITRIIVCINKMDTLNPQLEQKTSFDEIKSKTNTILNKIGYNTDKIAYIAVNGLSGDNILHHSATSMQWYKGFEIKRKKQDITGYTLLDALEKAVSIPKRRSVYKPFRMQINKTYNRSRTSIIATGIIQQGTVTTDCNVQLYPVYEVQSERAANVGSIEIHNHKIDIAKPGDCVGIKLLHSSKLYEGYGPCCGDVLIIRKHQNTVNIIKASVVRFVAMIKACHPSMRFKSANFVPTKRYRYSYISSWVYSHRDGYCPIIYVQNSKSICKIIEIRWKKQRSTNYKVYERNPQYIGYGDIAEVVFKVLRPVPCSKSPIALSTFKQYGPLGRIVGMSHNEIMFYGKVMEIIDDEYYNRLLFDGYMRIYVGGMQYAVNNDIKHLISRNLNYKFCYDDDTTRFDYERIAKELKKRKPPKMPKLSET